ncbi:response regulator [Pseudooctadecabacter jejudonensis]|nr:response regulator [Pseudooctadecabacter jejudonensis]
MVEDNEINRFVVRSMLEADGHKVTEAHDGQEGINLAHGQRFDLILMDISMPVVDGRVATQTIRAGDGASAQTRIVALTANALPEERADFLALGMEDVLTKPLSKPALRAVLGAAPARATPSNHTVLDMNHLSETRDALGEDNFQTMLGKLDAEIAAVAGWAHIDTPLDDLAQHSHKLAGSASLFGASDLAQGLRDLETSAKSKDAHGVAQRAADVTALSLRTRQALAALKAT